MKFTSDLLKKVIGNFCLENRNLIGKLIGEIEICRKFPWKKLIFSGSTTPNFKPHRRRWVRTPDALRHQIIEASSKVPLSRWRESLSKLLRWCWLHSKARACKLGVHDVRKGLL